MRLVIEVAKAAEVKLNNTEKKKFEVKRSAVRIKVEHGYRIKQVKAVRLVNESEAALLDCALTVVFVDHWPSLGVPVLQVAFVNEPVERVFDHGPGVLAVVPDRQPLLEHLLNRVELHVLVVAAKCGGGLALLSTVVDGAVVVASVSVQLNSKLLKLVVHLVVVLPQLPWRTQLLAAERAVELKLPWPPQTVPWLLARLGRLLSLGLVEALAESLGLTAEHLESPNHFVGQLVVTYELVHVGLVMVVQSWSSCA